MPNRDDQPETSLAKAAERARQAIHDDRVDELERILDQWPALLEWRDPVDGDVLLNATTSYANFPGPDEEEVQRILDTGAHGMLRLFAQKGHLPDNLRTRVALGDSEGVDECFDEHARLRAVARPAVELTQSNGRSGNWPPPGDDQLIVADAFLYSCRLGHREIANRLLPRCFARTPGLQQRVEAEHGAAPFVELMLKLVPEGARFDLLSRPALPPDVLWRCAVELRVHAALRDLDVTALGALFDAEPFLRGEESLTLQAKLLEVAAYTRGARPIMELLFDRAVAITETPHPPASHAISYALDYGHTECVPLLSKIWPIPDSLPHAAGVGDLAGVEKWFDATGALLISDHRPHNPYSEHSPNTTDQEILDRSFAWAVRSEQFHIADFLLERGADLNTRWGTHEAASVLHECAYAGDLAQVRYLVRKGIDRTMVDARHGATAQGWAEFAGHDEVARFLASEEPGGQVEGE